MPTPLSTRIRWSSATSVGGDGPVVVDLLDRARRPWCSTQERAGLPAEPLELVGGGEPGELHLDLLRRSGPRSRCRRSCASRFSMNGTSSRSRRRTDSSMGRVDVGPPLVGLDLGDECELLGDGRDASGTPRAGRRSGGPAPAGGGSRARSAAAPAQAKSRSRSKRLASSGSGSSSAGRPATLVGRAR